MTKEPTIFDKDVRIIILHETVLQSWLKDIGTFGSILAAVAINHFFLGDTTILHILLIAAAMSYGFKGELSRFNRTKAMTLAELTELINRPR